MKLGYNTNGLACHRWEEGLELLAELGYQSVALTLDHSCLDPFATSLGSELARMRATLDRLKLASVVETGARFLLNPRAKHEPTLLSPTREERQVRVEFLRRSIEIAAELGSEAVSFWSGILREPIGPEAALDRLAAGCREVLEAAERHQVRLAFEPEPGMFVDTMPRFAELHERVKHPSFGLTLDIGHLHCMGETPIGDHIRRWREVLWNVHIEDMRHGVHDHLMFGEGEIDFGDVMRTLAEVGYAGGVHVELSRHSHDAVETARKALAFLRAASSVALSGR